jgi:DNA-binding winged helix-turn-helix (wHTH) protein
MKFANFEVDVRAGELRKDGRKVRLQEQPFLLLTVLLESAGAVVTREELRKRLWSEDTFVDFDHRLAVAVSKLRDALRDSAEKPKFVATVGRRGYRFVGQLESTGSMSADSKVPIDETPTLSPQPSELGVLPKSPFLGPIGRRTSRLIFLSSVVFLVVLSVIVLSKFVHVRSAKEQSVCPRSLAILPAPKSWSGFE